MSLAISVWQPIASVVTIVSFTFNCFKSSGIAVISLDFSSTFTSPTQNPPLSTALTMWFAFCPSFPLPRWVFPSSKKRIFSIFSLMSPDMISFHRLRNSCRYSGETIAITRCIVSWEGISFGSSKYFLKQPFTHAFVVEKRGRGLDLGCLTFLGWIDLAIQPSGTDAALR